MHLSYIPKQYAMLRGVVPPAPPILQSCVFTFFSLYMQIDVCVLLNANDKCTFASAEALYYVVSTHLALRMKCNATKRATHQLLSLQAVGVDAKVRAGEQKQRSWKLEGNNASLLGVLLLKSSPQSSILGLCYSICAPLSLVSMESRSSRESKANDTAVSK